MFIRKLLLVSIMASLSTSLVGCTDVRESVKSAIRDVGGEQPEQAKEAGPAEQAEQPESTKQTGQEGQSRSSEQESSQVQTKVEVKVTIDGEDYTTYYGDGFSFDYPAEWEQKELSDSFPTIKAQFSSPTQIANVLVMVDEYKNAPAPAARDSKQIQVDSMNNGDGGGEITEFKERSFEEKPYGKYEAGVFVADYVYGQTKQSLVQTQYFVPIGHKNYMLMITTAKENTDSLQDAIDQMIDSFEVEGEEK